MHLRFNSVFGQLGQHQRERHVVAHRHVGIERIVLKHHSDVALFRLNVIDNLVTNRDGAIRNFFKTRNHAQQSGLATPRWTHQHTKLAIGNIKADPFDDMGLTKVFLYRLDGDGGHSQNSFEKNLNKDIFVMSHWNRFGSGTTRLQCDELPCAR